MATRWKVAGSIPDDVIGIFDWLKSLRLHYVLTEMSTGGVSWRIKAAGA